jgi:glycosyltransferase involved in cell wall biosynthesis
LPSEIKIDPSEVCFVGLGTSAVCYYRVLLPAKALGADWCGLIGEPPRCGWATGIARGQSRMPPLQEYKVVVIQQPRGNGWLNVIRELQDRGVKVLYEIDDYLHSIRKAEDHSFKEEFTKDKLAEYEKCMRVCDGLIASTEYIARRYRKFNQNTYVCENGLDMARYDLTRPTRPMVNIGWAGATGHTRAIANWLPAVARIMRDHDDTGFVSIGQPFAEPFKKAFPNRAVAVPFAAIEQYPGALTMVDIALAPAGKGGFFRGKSDLRWLEAGALGIPIIADPAVYPKIEHGVTGFHAENTQQVDELLERLVGDEALRTTVGANVERYVREERSIEVLAKNWMDVFEQVVNESV